MPEINQETEVKFFLYNLARMEEHLQTMEASLFQYRTHELNLRFDTPQGDFIRNGRVLRLRQDQSIHLTYKDNTQLKDGVLSRREIEFSVTDFDKARQFLEALGFEIVFKYEKFRTTYTLTRGELDASEGRLDQNIHIMLDELPYGNFIEIEGDFDKLRPLAELLGISWDAAIPASYHTLFDHVVKTRNLKFRDLCFDNFKDIKIVPSELGVIPGDKLITQ
jgi:adenylate cyclase, class 2